MNDCNKCEYPFKTLWRCKYGHHKEWVSICYNCIKEIRFVNVRFISQIENIKRKIRCRLNPTKIYLQLREYTDGSLKGVIYIDNGTMLGQKLGDFIGYKK